MMVPQHKAVRVQIVRRVDQLIHLTDRLVTGVRHLGLAKPEPFCCRCARQERERLRYGEAEIDREQRFKLARSCRCRILANAENAADHLMRGVADRKCLTKGRETCRERM